jgi:DNA ligase-1
LAERWERGAVDPTGWWVSEKLDGVRAYWNGHTLVSRLGKTLHAPAWFLAALPPSIALDGELFTGRGAFNETMRIVMQHAAEKAWADVAFVVFDAPAEDGPFEARARALDALVAALNVPHLRAVEHVQCTGVAHLDAMLARVIEDGGEGLMLRKAGSRYVGRRSPTLLKVKTFHQGEAIVRAHLAGTGHNADRVGSLECELPNGTRFSVGSGLTDAERESPPALGSVITFRYQELSRDGVPRFPTYVGVRLDYAWPPTRDQSIG